MTPVWSHTIQLESVARGVQQVDLVADVVTLAAIAKFLDVPGISDLRANLSVRAWLDGAEITGRFSAVVTQVCGVSLEEFEQKVVGRLDVRAVPSGSPHAIDEAVASDVEFDSEAADPPDVLDGQTLDLAVYLVEQLALELDPFPRKPGVEFQPPEPETDTSPFAVLRQLKGNLT